MLISPTKWGLLYFQRWSLNNFEEKRQEQREFGKMKYAYSLQFVVLSQPNYSRHNRNKDIAAYEAETQQEQIFEGERIIFLWTVEKCSVFFTFLTIFQCNVTKPDSLYCLEIHPYCMKKIQLHLLIDLFQNLYSLS